MVQASGLEEFQEYALLCGMVSICSINLGTSILSDRVGWSNSKLQKRTLHWSGISFGCQAFTSNPLQIGFTVQANFSFAPNKVNFIPSNSFAKNAERYFQGSSSPYRLP